VAPYSSTRFLVLLPLASFQDARQVVQRIEKKFRFVCRRDDVVLSTEIGSLT
jgi:GGDEF domain-containing protein